MKTRRSAILRRDGGFKTLVNDGRCVTLKWQTYCQYCNAFLEGVKQMTVDHIVPRSKGGSDDLDNLVICCEPCNTKKSDKMLVDFLAEMK